MNISIPLLLTRAMASEVTPVSPRKANPDENSLKMYYALEASVGVSLIVHLIACADVPRWSTPTGAVELKIASRLRMSWKISSYTMISLRSSIVELSVPWPFERREFMGYGKL